MDRLVPTEYHPFERFFHVKRSRSERTPGVLWDEHHDPRSMFDGRSRAGSGLSQVLEPRDGARFVDQVDGAGARVARRMPAWRLLRGCVAVGNVMV
jgi:hypothetical protein